MIAEDNGKYEQWDDGSNPSFILSLSSDPTWTMRTGKGDGADPLQPSRAQARNRKWGERRRSEGTERKGGKKKRVKQVEVKKRRWTGTGRNWRHNQFKDVPTHMAGKVHRREKLGRNLHICDPVIRTLAVIRG